MLVLLLRLGSRLWMVEGIEEGRHAGNSRWWWPCVAWCSARSSSTSTRGAHLAGHGVPETLVRDAALLGRARALVRVLRVRDLVHQLPERLLPLHVCREHRLLPLLGRLRWHRSRHRPRRARHGRLCGRELPVK